VNVRIIVPRQEDRMTRTSATYFPAAG